MKDNLWTTNAKWSGFHLVETRTHRRIMLQPCGAPLEGFANLSELLLAIKDIVKCVQDLLEKKVLHRDISLRNIILAKANPKDANSRMRAYLIDFDYALDLENQSQAAAKGARTGTLPFMALEMLAEETSNRVKHAYYHDLESIFYVLCWLCTSQEGPNNTERDHRTFDFNKSEVAKWTGAGMDNPTFDAIKTRKSAIVCNDTEFTEKILSDFAPYFDSIKRCVLKLRDMMINKGSNPYNPLVQERVDEAQKLAEKLNKIGEPVPYLVLKEIPNSEREPCDVFESLYNIIDEAIATLIEPPLPPACTPEAKARAKAEEEARKEAKRMKFRNYLSIREMQEERETNLRVKESEVVDEDEETEEGRDDPSEKPGSQLLTRATSSYHSLLKQATTTLMNARNTSSSVPGLTHSGPSDSASGTNPRSIPSSSSSPKPDPRVGPPSSMESIGSKRPFDDNNQKSAHGHGRSTPKKAKKASGLGKSPQPKGPCIQRPSLDRTMPSSVESTRSKRSSAESFDDDSVTSDSQKRIRLEKL
ncbi:uncharacterized protein FOMMEDRAFT_167852 [Fomitiporia mediterranea MF3/22]|uniref:uncharacterized protein n=1 Tax=Fomitiporia mediterranea (strain MF3/22) TaxID=694068 RepID=UPI0004407884|nr:uncharacterized protein FOMMEDRAFT_167852 [Fomitiporia mediterranea MF3/22]EJD02664.1 hypothetical protein FOMMEDRAFT_167852 [Fomitiporia mediterranea MF3/22]